MSISSDKLKALRDARAWSQQHLADAAGLSVRTVQRVEAEGTASAETRLALAAALDISVDTLGAQAEAQSPAAAGRESSVLVFAASAVGVLFTLWLGRRLPPTVASHFGVSGMANGWMSRNAFVASMVGFTAVLPSLMWWSMERAARRGTAKIPNAAHWFSEPHRAATARFLRRQSALMCLAVTAMGCGLFWLVVQANTAPPPRLDMDLVLLGLGVFLAFTTAWLAALNARFRRTMR